MSNFQIQFTYPLVLLLLIPAVFFTLFGYFRLSKKYRRTRNRIISIVLHLTAMVLSITALAGLHFTYDEPNPENEMLLLVDVSYSSQETQQQKDEFVHSVLESSDESVKVGVVTFGYEQTYAAPFSYDTNEVYMNYRNADLPDDSATDIASALNYAKELFTNPKTAKIVLLTDGVETDGDALSVIKAIAAEGIKVDVMHYPVGVIGNEVQLIGVELPTTRIELDSPVELGVTIQSSYAGTADVVLYDNDVMSERVSFEVVNGVKTAYVMHTFKEMGMHALRFETESATDTLEQNNVYYSYVNLEVYNRILILERTAGEAENLQEMLASKVFPEGEEGYAITTVAIGDLANVPSSVKALRKFDQVILVNIANADMPVFADGVRFDEILHDYVYEYGGGMLTIGGNKDEEDENGDPIANTYDREDMYGTLYQDMLPVEAIDYTPPAGVMIIIDWSGSMSSVDPETNKTYLQLAKEGARSAVNALTERDYCGIVSLEDSYREEIKPIALPKKEELFAAIDNLGEDQSGGGTVYQGAIEQAGSALKKLTVVERKHIILVSDGMPSDTYETYGPAIESNYEAGITMSIILVGSGGEIREMERAAEAGGGRCHVGKLSTIPDLMREELELPEIKAVNYTPFNPQIGTMTSALKGISEEELDKVQLGGFYGTKLKTGAVQTLKGDYVPIYAQWDYGMGKVGSFMCDLNDSDWSSEFIAGDVGKKFINNVVGDIFPITNIRSQDVEVKLLEDNYGTQVNIYPDAVTAGTKFDVQVKSLPTEANPEPTVQETTLEDSESYRKASFAIKQAGVHEITVQQVDAEGNNVANCLTYKTFSYSEEYNMFFDAEACLQMLTELTENGNGSMITSAEEAFNGLEKVLHRSYDPVLPFIIIVLVLFLLDVAVRKFKFKWPHEIIRDRKIRKMMEKK